jgi:hypothetical protein
MSRHRTLSEIEGEDRDSPQVRRPGRFRDNRRVPVWAAPLGQYGGCWCGQECNHSWEGKADGAPHPR